jgi:hypothetical protein
MSCKHGNAEVFTGATPNTPKRAWCRSCGELGTWDAEIDDWQWESHELWEYIRAQDRLCEAVDRMCPMGIVPERADLYEPEAKAAVEAALEAWRNAR